MSEWKECPKCKCMNLNREMCQDCWRDLKDVAPEQPKDSETAEAKGGSLERVVQRHKWIIHYADERGQAHHHQTIFEDEVREIAAKALASGMISLTVLRTLNPVPLNDPSSATPPRGPVSAPDVLERSEDVARGSSGARG